MAGVKGKSGGPRQNAGGARPGAGRKPTPPVLFDIPATNDPLEFLRLVMVDNAAEIKIRIAAAVALLPYVHAKKVEGVKDKKQDAAKKAGTGRFGASAPPVRLVTV